MKVLVDWLLILKGSVAAASIIIGAASIHYWGSDNPVEECAEEVFKAQTGIDVDFSPGTPEKQKGEIDGNKQ